MKSPGLVTGLATDESTVKQFQHVAYGDPTTRFSESIQSAAISLETRSDDELARDARQNSDAAWREHSLFQLLARRGVKALPVLREALFEDPDSDLRVNTLWTLEWLGSPECREICLALMDDADHRVREWARVFAWEMKWTDQDFRRAREYKYYEGRTFDETIYLHITCNLYIRLGEGADMWGHMLMSPQMLAKVYGQAKACPIIETRDREIVIAKTLSGLHGDDTLHHEAFLFRGFTEKTNANTGNFYFETHTERPVYLSGKAEDHSEGYENVIVPFAREGQWFTNENIKIKGEDGHRVRPRLVPRLGLRQPRADREERRRVPLPWKLGALDPASPGGRPEDQHVLERTLQGQGRGLERRRHHRSQLPAVLRHGQG